MDTNVLVRAHARAAGSGRALLKALTAFDHVLILSPFILSEVERVLNYPRMQRLLSGVLRVRIAEKLVENAVSV